ncbi:MAG: VIT domain-containing protein [Planctomycetaceae bacterium]
MRLRQTQNRWLLAATVAGLICVIHAGCGQEGEEVGNVASSPTARPETTPAFSQTWRDDAAAEDTIAAPVPASETVRETDHRTNDAAVIVETPAGPDGTRVKPEIELPAAAEFAEEKLPTEASPEPGDGLSDADGKSVEAIRSRFGTAQTTDGGEMGDKAKYPGAMGGYPGVSGGDSSVAGRGGAGVGGYAPDSAARSDNAGLSKRRGREESRSAKEGRSAVEAPATSADAPELAGGQTEADDSRDYQAGHRFMLMDGFDAFENKSKKEQRNQRPLTFDLQPGEELWIIAKAVDTPQPAMPNPEVPGCGALMAQLPNAAERVPVPLKHTSVEGTIDGYIASVDVTQQFHNPYSSKIEAVYVFPLPEDAAVNEFVMTVGDRKIRGIIREREKAEQIYANARRQGHVASLLTQERPNIFTQKVANIEPGKQIDINIRYFSTLRYDDGAYEFVFPMVVGPRFNPPATTDGVGAVARGAHGSSGQSTEVQYLAPHERSGHDISLTLNINAGVDIEDIHSVNHAVKSQPISECRRKIELASNDTIPNRDFVLRYRVAGDQIKTALLTHEDEQGKYFTMMLYPPAELKSVRRSPMEMVFVLDCSGSMSGKPIEQAKTAIAHALQSLTPRDTFQIIQFSNNSSQLGSEPVVATAENIGRGLRYLNGLSGSGGTQMIEGIKAALDFPHDEGRFRLVSFMTDGYIGNEQQILGTLRSKLGPSRVFSFGVGQSPNRYLMDRMAMEGRGAVAYLSLNDDAAAIMDHFNQRISHPAMTDLSIDWGTMKVADVYPERLPDLIVGRPVILTGRFKGEPGTVKVGGLVGMEPTSFAVSLDEDDATEKHNGIAAVWARMKIKDLMMDATGEPSQAAEVQQLVTQTALNYNLMSSFTAFVAVDSMSKTSGDFGTTVAVPVPVPEGVKYETTVR